MDLSHLILEDSYVLGISIEPYRLEFLMDFVLAPEHPHYQAPAAGEQECFRRGVIRIVDFRTIVWRASNLRPSTDASGELDYGFLDEFEIEEGLATFRGDWGEIEVEQGRLVVGFE